MDVVIAGARPFDGRYPMIPFNRYEQGQIRRLAGWMPLQYDEALEGGDAEFVAAIAVLAMKRAGKVAREEVAETFQKLLDMDAAEIVLEGDEEEAADEPVPPTGSSGENRSLSGQGSRTSSGTSETTPKHNGTQDSDTSESDLRTLAG